MGQHRGVMRPPLLSLFRPVVTLAFVLALGSACSAGSGGFDGGVFPDSGPYPSGPTAADIGVKCEYDARTQANPSNTCPSGLSCLIVTYDGLYVPFPASNPTQNFTHHIWEDHFTVYRDDGIDEGYCTLIGTWDNPPFCPAGTELKLLSTNLAVCLRSCQGPADCGRQGYTCDRRFLDVGPTCVRGCTLDYPECVRSGQAQRPNQPNVIALHLEASDLGGSSYCDVGSGICQGNPGGGFSGPGEPCDDTRDCIAGAVCVQGDLIEAVNPALPANSPGFCGMPCKPDPDAPLEGGCIGGYACQAGFVFGHGNPYDKNLEDANGFLLYNSLNGDYLEAGGFCFPNADKTGGECSTYPGTTQGRPSTTTFRNSMGGVPWQWNNVTMCLVDSLRE